MGRDTATVHDALPPLCRSRYKPVVNVSGHRWSPLYCLQYDSSGTCFVTGADDK
jgi:hypothetical protein